MRCWLAPATCILASLAFASPSSAGTARAVPTFESIGVYWPLSDQAQQDHDGDCAIAFRAKGEEDWRDGLPLWYDPDASECRGSLVGLRPGTSYELRLSLDSGLTEELQARTWSEAFPIGKVVPLPEFSSNRLHITQSGTPDGYVLYAPAPGKPAVIDVGKQRDFNVIIDARYVILRGVTLKGARHSGILLGKAPEKNSSDVSDIVIENNDISAWGENDPRCNGKRVVHGKNLQAAIYSFSDRLQRVVIQRNRLHHPSTAANNWTEENCGEKKGSRHPMGPQGITLRSSLGHLVIRYNEIYSDELHGFNDAMGEPVNFSKAGFPRRDSDIYGNFISNAWDDGIEAEGAGENVRIWGNYIDRVMIPIALAPVSKGPIYVWRNLSHVTRSAPGKKRGGPFIKYRLYKDKKTGAVSAGRIYLFNNTSLIPRQGTGTSGFIVEFKGNPLTNIVSLNNIMSVENSRKNYSVRDRRGIDNLFDYDLLVGRTAFSDRPQPQELHGVRSKPRFVPHWGLDAAALRGTFSLMPLSPGYDQGTIIPNFADHFIGHAPDIGAHEADTPEMEFGVHAYEAD